MTPLAGLSFLGHHRRNRGESDTPGDHETDEVFHGNLLLPCLPPTEGQDLPAYRHPVPTPEEGQVLPERHILSRACSRREVRSYRLILSHACPRWRSGLTGLSCIPRLPPERVQVLPERKKAQVIHWHFCCNGDLRPVRRTYENN